MLVASRVVPAWQATLAERLSTTRGIELAIAVHEAPEDERTTRPFLLPIYDRLDAAVFRWPLDALAPHELAGVASAPESFAGQDVVLDLTSSSPVEVARGARYGAWVVTHDPADWQRRGPTYRTRVHAHFGDGRRVLVHSSIGATDAASPARTRQQALWKAQGTLRHLLETVRRLGFSYLEERARRPTDSADAGGDDRPSNRSVAAGAARAAAGVAGRLVRAAVQREAWFVATRPRAERRLGSGEGFVATEWSRREASADPFVVDDDGGTYVFFEDDSRGGPATIACVRVDPFGRPEGRPVTVLARPYHLSYPFVFERDGAHFMIPETSANRTVELYRADPFPTRWTLERVLLEDVRALDATLHATEDRLWLFVTMSEAGAKPDDELHLYSSSELAAPWDPHPANPVVSDVRSARPAGRLFAHDGRWIRPAQDCSRRYGYAVVFNRVDVLDENDYAESPVARLEPGWAPGVFATHTYTFGSSVEAVDGKRRVLRRPFRASRG